MEGCVGEDGRTGVEGCTGEEGCTGLDWRGEYENGLLLLPCSLVMCTKFGAIIEVCKAFEPAYNRSKTGGNETELAHACWGILLTLYLFVCTPRMALFLRCWRVQAALKRVAAVTMRYLR